jgi:hypothetical protein
MKKMIALVITILLILGLSACNMSSSTNTANSTSSDSKTLSTVEELALGTLKLEGTDQAVDQTQAATLLPLWQAYIELQNNNSIATEEVDAVISQIQSSMTTDQTKAINDLKFTSQDLMDTMTSLGITNTMANLQGTPSASTGQDTAGGFQGDTTGGSAPAGGAPPSGGGGPQAGGGGPGGSNLGTTNLSQSQIATMQAYGGTAQGAKGITGLIEKLIRIFQQKIQS